MSDEAGVTTSEDMFDPYDEGQGFYWKTKDGKKMKPEDMETSHIKNCVRMLERQLANRPDEYAYGEPDGDMAQDAFHAEIRHNDQLEEDLREAVKIFEHELKRREQVSDLQLSDHKQS